MSQPPATRPPDVDDLATARALIATLHDQLTKSQRENAALRHQLDVLCQRLFGRKADRVDPRQLQLALEQLANEPGAVTEPVEMDSGETPVQGYARRKPSGRRPLPGHLPRRHVEIDVPDAEKACPCGHARVRMGDAVTEKLEYEPASFVIVETVRAKYACRPVTTASSRPPPRRKPWSARWRRKASSRMSSCRSTSTICRCTGSSASSPARGSIWHGRPSAAGWRMWPRRSRRSTRASARRSPRPPTSRPTTRRSRS